MKTRCSYVIIVVEVVSIKRPCTTYSQLDNTCRWRNLMGGSVNNTFRKSRVFLPYARADEQAFAGELRTRLEAEHIPLWQDRVSLEGGRDWWFQIVEALDQVEFMVLVMTPAALESPM